jgi:hypothetical protein
VAIQQTSCSNTSDYWDVNVILRIAGATSTTNPNLALNINQKHTLRAELPFNEPPNNCSRVKNSLTNTTTNDQYKLEIAAEQDSVTLRYFWQLTITLNLPGGGADQEVIVFRTPSQTDLLSPGKTVTSFSRYITAADTNLDFSAATITLNYVAPALAAPPTISEFIPAQGEVVSSTSQTLSWTGDYPTYNVEFGTDTGVNLVSEGQAGTTYNPGTLTDGVEYWYRITGIKSDGTVDEYPYIQFRVLVSTPADWVWMDDTARDWIGGTQACWVGV